MQLRVNSVNREDIYIESEELSRCQIVMKQRRRERTQKLLTIRSHFEQKFLIHPRKEQSLLLYLVNLVIPITLSGLNAYILLGLGQNSQIKGYLIIVFVSIGFLFSIISNLQITSWKEVFKLYFLMIDSIIPVLISGIIGFFSIFNFLSTGQWYEHGFAFCFPFWVIYFAGNLRVMIAYEKWSKWKVIVYKVVVLGCGLIFFYVGVDYMNGAYKLTMGYFPTIEAIIKNMVYLYVFGNTELFFMMYRKLSSFDQTEELKYVYQFQDHQQKQNKAMFDSEMVWLEQQIMNQELEEDHSAQESPNDK